MSHMEFTLSVSNCLSCTFCPQEKLGAAYHSDKRMMTVEDFTTILNKLPMDCQVDFSGFAEAMLNPNACKMMELAAQSGRKWVLYTTLVGIKPCCVEVLKRYTPSVTRVHCPDGKALIFPEDKWVEFHERFLLSHVPATYMAMHEPSDFIKRYLAIKDIPLEFPDMLSRGGNLEHIKTREINGPIKCTMNRWHGNLVLPNGDVYGCCMDYGLTVYLGNLLRQPYREIHWEAEKWEMNMLRDATGTICSKCEWATPA